MNYQYLAICILYVIPTVLTTLITIWLIIAKIKVRRESRVITFLIGIIPGANIQLLISYIKYFD